MLSDFRCLSAGVAFEMMTSAASLGLKAASLSTRQGSLLATGRTTVLYWWLNVPSSYRQ